MTSLSKIRTNSSSGGGGLKPQAFIYVPADFPGHGSPQEGDVYFVAADVTDNDPTKTNTGQSFAEGQIIAWGKVSWVLLDPVNFWADDDSELYPIMDRKLSINEIVEKTADHGVIIDGVLIKDKVITADRNPITVNTQYMRFADVSTFEAITLSGVIDTVDGETLIANETRVLVKDQVAKKDNGIYIAKVGLWTRATDFNTDSDIRNSLIKVKNGFNNALKLYQCANTTPIAVGITDITFTEFQSGGGGGGGFSYFPSGW